MFNPKYSIVNLVFFPPRFLEWEFLIAPFPDCLILSFYMFNQRFFVHF